MLHSGIPNPECNPTPWPEKPQAPQERLQLLYAFLGNSAFSFLIAQGLPFQPLRVRYPNLLIQTALLQQSFEAARELMMLIQGYYVGQSADHIETSCIKKALLSDITSSLSP